MGKRDYVQWKAREDAMIKYSNWLGDGTPIALTRNQKRTFETAFDMGWKEGRKRERRVNFKYLLKSKYAQPGNLKVPE